MRNGLDISGVSEFVHEIGEKPVEAVIDFNTTAVLGARGAEVSIRTAHHGTVRMARSFQIPFTEDRADPFAGLSAHEAAVAALGACVLITHVHGYSARAVTITSLSVVVSAAVEVDERGRWVGGDTALHDLRYDIRADCDGPTASLTEVSQFVTCFSPNHRAFLDEGSYVLTALTRRSDGSHEAVTVEQTDPAAPVGEPSRIELTAELTWQYGTEANVTTMRSPDGELRRQQPSLVVDQSKQMAGIDGGPNPQEVLLAAVSADLCQDVSRLARERGLALHNVDVAATGRLDIRGMLNVSKDIPARFHNLQFTVSADTDLPARALADLVAECAAVNVTLATLRTAGTVEVDLHTPDRPLLSFRSDADQVEDFLAVLAQKQAAAMAAGANNALDASR
jgi:uncharacterized OsmC-like protein